MKLIIATQYMENYGAHDWDGEGECPQYWKAKGGTTYVVENLTQAQVDRAVNTNIPTLRKLIERDNEFIREYVINVFSVVDAARVGEKWETPVFLSYKDGVWTAREVTGGEYSCLRKEIETMTRTWILEEGGETEDFKVEFKLRDGRVVDTLEAL